MILRSFAWMIPPLLLAHPRANPRTAPSDDFLRLPLRERCEMATTIAREVVVSQDFKRAWYGFLHDQVFLFISSKSELRSPQPDVSIFRTTEDCDPIAVERPYLPRRRVSVTLGKGRLEDLDPNRLFHLARLRRLGAYRWELLWRPKDYIWACPWSKDGVKASGKRHHGPGIEACASPATMGPPAPTLRLTLERTEDRTYVDEAPILEFIRSPSKSAPEGNPNLLELPLGERCDAAKRVAKEIVKVFGYAQWYGLPRSRVFLRILSSDGQSGSGAHASLLRKGETCADLRAGHCYITGPDVAVQVAAEEHDNIPWDRGIFEVRARTLAPGRWEFTWVLDRKYWTCPKPDEDHYVGFCLDPATASIPTPTLRVVLARDPSGGMHLESSRLEFPLPSTTIRETKAK